MGLDNVLNKTPVEDYLKNWYGRGELKESELYHFFVLWGIGIAHNALLFDNRSMHSFHSLLVYVLYIIHANLQ